MKIYLDYVFFINFLFDFILLLCISIVLKRTVLNGRIVLGSIVGGLSGFLILLPVSSLLFFILKLLLGLIMVVVTFSYKSITYTWNNFIYLIILSVLMGGGLYLVNIELSKTILGNEIVNSRMYMLILVIISFVVMYIYSRYISKARLIEKNKYKVVLYVNNKKLALTGFLDTGNNLIYKNRPVLILNKDIDLDVNNKVLYIPFSTINSSGLMKCIKVKEIEVENKRFKNIYLALSNDKFHLKDADIILNINLWEGNNENIKETNQKNKTFKNKK